MTPLRLILDARMWRHGGIGTYLRGLVPALAQSGRIEHGCVLGGPSDVDGHDGVWCQQPFAAPIYSVAEQLARPWPRHGAHLWHSPHLNIPLRWEGPLVVTVHDLTHIHFPRFARSRFAAPYTAFMLRQVARRAKVVITPSEATKRDLCAWSGLDPDRVTVIPHGVSPAFGNQEAPEIQQRILQRYGVVPPFILWVSAIRPHKNPIMALRAFARAKTAGRLAYQLVMVGRTDACSRAPRQEARRLGVEHAVRWVGEIPLDDLPALYHTASVLLMPSRAEGFGFPVAEALAAGLPVIASAIPALTELIGDAGITLPPDDLEGWADRLRWVLTDDAATRAYRAAGHLRAQRWTWDEAARRHLAVYHRALEMTSP